MRRLRSLQPSLGLAMVSMCRAETDAPAVSVVIPTYGRDRVLIDTIAHLRALAEPPAEILVVDQTPEHDGATRAALERWASEGAIRWLRLPAPSITRAMNEGLLAARGEVVLYVDDDIVPCGELVRAHRCVHADSRAPAADRAIVAGRVLQPWHVDGSRPPDRLASEAEGFVDEFIGCNFSVDRATAIALGGFDERFVRVAYRFEAEFAARARRAGYRIRFAPAACIHHLRAPAGGTRSYGEHLRTLRPAHAVGQYYYLLRVRPRGWAWQFLVSPLRAIGTRFHRSRPWWIPPMLLAQFLGAGWALAQFAAGPKRLDPARVRLAGAGGLEAPPPV